MFITARSSMNRLWREFPILPLLDVLRTVNEPKMTFDQTFLLRSRDIKDL